MPKEPVILKRNLPRLQRDRYQGYSVVFWTHTFENRSRGWLTHEFHRQFRELMLHAAARESLFCPAYCLMPDHFHLLWMGCRRDSDQLNATKFLREYVGQILEPEFRLQRQAHDHVLREEERQKDALSKFCNYTLANRVRAGLVESETAWRFSGSIVPGYPSLNPFRSDYWNLFWKLHAAVRAREASTSP